MTADGRHKEHKLILNEGPQQEFDRLLRYLVFACHYT